MTPATSCDGTWKVINRGCAEELAYRIQMEATDALDISREPKDVLDFRLTDEHGHVMKVILA